VNAPEHPGERLSAYVDDELPPADRTAVEAHLRECAACSRLLEELLAVDSAALSLTVQAPAGYFEAFPERVRARLLARRARRVPAWTWAAAAALLLAVITPLTILERRDAPSASVARDEAPTAQRVPATAATAAPPTTTPDARLRSFGYVAGGPATREAKEQAPRRQVQKLDDRLSERDQASGFGGGRAAELKKEAPGTDKRAADAPARAEAPAERVDEQRQQGMAASRAEPAAPPPPPAAAPEGAAPAQPAKAKAGEDSDLRARKNAATPVQSVSAPTTLGSADDSGVALNGALVVGEEFESLASQPLRTAAQARAAARAWGEHARRHPEPQTADEARVRAVEAMAIAWRLDRKPADRDQARALAQAYLAGDGPQKGRVRAVLEQLAR